MSNTTFFVLGALVGAGITCVVIAFDGHGPASRSDGTNMTISKATPAAWQVLRRLHPTEPAEPQAEIATIRPQPPLSVQTVPPPLDGVSLTRALQRELKKIGCYRGDVNGVWTSATRQAMKAFTHLANAKLPIDQPTHVLLALVQRALPRGSHQPQCAPGRRCCYCPTQDQGSRIDEGPDTPSHATYGASGTKGIRNWKEAEA